MSVDVQVAQTIDSPVETVAAYAADPSNAPKWYRRIHTVNWITDPPATVGSRIAFEAKFLGKRLVYTYEVVEYVPCVALTMTTAEGPFPMTTEYRWSPVEVGRTRMTLRNFGEPTGFSKHTAPIMAFAMRRAMTQDLRRLATILEST
ncbi:MAG TPA: SRPBCC family protein [Acidimicrobiales bacterium]|nr:SRPBCC family protein [Acidimicrobiales bacterium]